MFTANVVLVILLLLFAWWGSRQGFVQALFQLIGAIVAYVLAKHWSPILGSVLARLIPQRAGLAELLAFILLFFLIERAVGFVLHLVAKALKLITGLPIIASLNSLLGGLVGLAEGFVFIGSTVYLLLSLRLDPALVTWLGSSSVARFCERVFLFTLRFLV